MKTWIGAAVIGGALALASPAAIDPAAAASPQAGVTATDPSKATDLSARRRHRHYIIVTVTARTTGLIIMRVLTTIVT